MSDAMRTRRGKEEAEARAHLVVDEPSDCLRLGEVDREMLADPVIERLDCWRVLCNGKECGSRSGLSWRSSDMSTDVVAHRRGRSLEKRRRGTGGRREANGDTE